MTQPPSVDGVGPADPDATTSGRYSTKAVLGLIFAIVSFVFVAVPILNWVIAIPAVLLSHLAVREIRATRDRGHDVALAGLVLGYLSIGVSVLILIGAAVTVASNSPQGSDHGACVTRTQPTERQMQACVDSYNR